MVCFSTNRFLLCLGKSCLYPSAKIQNFIEIQSNIIELHPKSPIFFGSTPKRVDFNERRRIEPRPSICNFQSFYNRKPFVVSVSFSCGAVWVSPYKGIFCHISPICIRADGLRKKIERLRKSVDFRRAKSPRCSLVARGLHFVCVGVARFGLWGLISKIAQHFQSWRSFLGKCPLVFASGCWVVGRYVCVSGLSLHYAMRVDMQNIPLKIL